MSSYKLYLAYTLTLCPIQAHVDKLGKYVDSSPLQALYRQPIYYHATISHREEN